MSKTDQRKKIATEIRYDAVGKIPETMKGTAMRDETRQGETDKTGQCRSLMKQRSICIGYGYPLSRAPILYSTLHLQLESHYLRT